MLFRSMGRANLFMPLFMDAGMSALPFFVLGYYLKKTPFLYPNKYDRYWIPLILSMLAVVYLFEVNFHCFTYFLDNQFGDIIPTFISVTLSVLILFLLCKKIKWLPLISYVGRYSIVVLCVHEIVLRTLLRFSDMLHLEESGINTYLDYRWIILLITLTLSFLAIPICKRFIPMFVAQRDLLLPKEGIVRGFRKRGRKVS